MNRSGITLLKRSWPLGLLAIPFAAVCCLLLVCLSESIEARAQMSDFSGHFSWRGVETLFFLNAFVLGWVSVVVSERRLGAVGPSVLLFALPCCFAAIGGGFALSLWSLDDFTTAMKEMLALSIAAGAGACILRVYVADLL